MIKNIIAKRYSKALIGAFSDEKLKSLENEAKLLINFMDKNPKIEAFFLSPIADNEIKKEVLIPLAEGLKFSHYFHNFLKILIDKDRIYFLRDICDEIVNQIHNRLLIREFKIITASKIDENVVKKIKSFVNKYVSGEIHFTHKIDKKIRGGFLVFSKNLVLDASIKNNLKNIEKKF